MIDSQFTSLLRSAAKNIPSAILLATLAGCISQPTTPRPADTQNVETRARAAVQSGNLAAAAELYAQLAASATGTARSGFLLESVRLLGDQGDAAVARRRLTDARTGASREQQLAITVLFARLEVRERRPQAALDLLASLQPPLPMSVESDEAAVRGQALFQLGRPAEAVRALTERELWLENGDAILANQRLIWNGLREFPPRAPLPLTGDRVIDGWLALAPLANNSSADLRRELLSWRQTYTDHPAAGRLLAELLALQRSVGFPSQIALLLPLSSVARSEAIAIRDGFVAAHLRGTAAQTTAIRVYDTAELGSQQAYLRAQLEGADFIVGPLLQEDVEQVIAQAGFVPTLALNVTRNETPALNSFYQYALASADEARVVAAAAAASGAATAIAFVPSTDAGYRILGSFREEFEAHGGRLIDFNGYEPRAQDFAQAITGLLNISRSAARQRRLQANLGTPVAFEPRRRQDIDAIFVVADSRTGRVLAPQLRFHGAGQIPTYATSAINPRPGSEVRDSDLNGIMFPDAPSVLTPDSIASDLKRTLQTYWPQRTDQVRLYSMGFDAYQLVTPLYNGSRNWPFAGMSGELSLDGQGRIHRNLPLAQFRNGLPVAIDAAAPSARRSNELLGNR